MRKFTIRIFSFATVLLMMAFSVNTVLGQVVDYRTQVGSDGNWSTPANWQIYNGTTWVTATNYPTSADGVITITKAMSININVTVDQVVCASGAALTINNGFTLTIASGTTKPDFTELNTSVTVNGTLIINSGAIVTGGGLDEANKGTITVNSGGNLYLDGSIKGSESVEDVNWTTTVNAGGIMTISNTGTFSVSKAYANTVKDALIIYGIVKTYDGAVLQVPDYAILKVYGILELAPLVVITGRQFYLYSGGTLKIGATTGIISATGIYVGNVQTYFKNFYTGANYIYNGGSDQVFGAGLPTTVNSLTIANPLGVFSFSAAQTVTNDFFIASGSKVNLGTFNHTATNLYLGGIAQVFGSWGSTASSATYTNSIYFGTTATGLLTVAVPTSTRTTVATGNWSTISTWSVGGVPSATDDVTILHNVSVTDLPSAPASCRNLTINSGASITIQPGKALTVKGTLVNNGTLTIKSDATGTGSLIHYTAGVTAAIERYIAAANWTIANNGWHLLSSPVASQSISGTFTPTGTNNDYDFYAFDELKLNGCWLNQKVGENAINTFGTGRSYLVAYQQAGTKTFTGNINATDVTISSLANTAGSSYPGWHLLGNPFASAINWATGNWTKTNVDAIAQVWDAATASYKTITEKGNIIPAMNGFMVHTSGSGSITIPADARVHNAGNLYKSSDEEFILLKANDLEGSTSQSSILRFNPLATEGYDSEFDSYFLSCYAPMFYSKSENEYYALNTLPSVTESKAVSFGFVKNASSKYTLELSRSITGEILCLEDIKTSVIQNLTENPVYAFTSAEGDDPNRFVLHFLDPTGVKPGISSGIQIYAGNKTLYISQTDAQKSIVTVYNSTGQVLRKQQLQASFSQELSLQDFVPGIYVVAIQTGKGLYNQKVVVK
jgi:hypothetical protein